MKSAFSLLSCSKMSPPEALTEEFDTLELDNACLFSHPVNTRGDLGHIAAT